MAASGDNYKEVQSEDEFTKEISGARLVCVAVGRSSLPLHQPPPPPPLTLSRVRYSSPVDCD
jgi:hypothetical protein